MVVGWSLFGSWRHETEEQQRHKYDEIGLGDFKDISSREYTQNDTLPF